VPKGNATAFTVEPREQNLITHAAFTHAPDGVSVARLNVHNVQHQA
jgi:hypothetical protein